MNELNKFSEIEWLKYQQSNTGQSIKELIVEEEELSAMDKFKQMIINEEIECDGMCTDCGCAELEREVISHPKEDVAQARKETPVFSGVLSYFPDAIKAIAQCSFIGNEQHNPNTPLHWDRSKSGDELDALTRHLIDAGTLDTDGIKHSTKVAWRALANLQKEIENDNNKGTSSK